MIKIKNKIMNGEDRVDRKLSHNTRTNYWSFTEIDWLAI